jgi:hypothetical protein
MPFSDPTTSQPVYESGRIYLTGFNTDDFQSVEVLFAINYRNDWGTGNLDEFVQTFIDYIAASPNVTSVELQKHTSTEQVVSPTEES